MKTIYRCPKCKGPLTVSERVAICPAGHSYDRAREGYFNLLLHQSGGTHGDNADMLRSRRALLDSGLYAPLAREICRLACDYLPKGGTVLDGGAGEGYYTDLLQKALQSAGKQAEVYAFDISKDAVKLMSKRNKSLHLAVCGVYDMPIEEESVSLHLNLFAPFCREEVYRTLAPGGYLLMAVPGREHLYGLKCALYDAPYYNEVSDAVPAGFAHVHTEELYDRVTLTDPAHIRALFAMTPYAYRTDRQGRERLEALTDLNTPISFRVLLYQKL